MSGDDERRVDPKLRAEWFWVDRWMSSSGFLLPPEPRCLYREMMSQAWIRGGRLPNDHEAIQRAVAFSETEWARAWPKVERYWRVDGDSLVNDTQLEILAAGEHIRSVRSEAGRRGGFKSGAKRQAKSKQTAKQNESKAPTKTEALSPSLYPYPLEQKQTPVVRSSDDSPTGPTPEHGTATAHDRGLSAPLRHDDDHGDDENAGKAPPANPEPPPRPSGAPEPSERDSGPPARPDAAIAATADPPTPPPRRARVIPVNWPDLEANVLRGTLERLRQAGWVGRSTAGEVRFFQAVAHVRRFKPDAPGGLLREILVNDRFDLVTIADEDEGDLIRKGMEDRRKALTQLDDPEARFRWLNEQKAKLDEWHAKNLDVSRDGKPQPESGGGR